MPQYRDKSPEIKDEVAQRLFEKNLQAEEAPNEKPAKLVDSIDDFLKYNPRWKRTFTKRWKQAFRDTEGPPAVREKLCKLWAMTAIRYEQAIVESASGSSMISLNGINQLRQEMVGLAETLGIEPGKRKPGKGKEETLSEVLSATEKAKELKNQAGELEQADRKLLEDEDTG